MTDELRFEGRPEEGVRHPSEGRELRDMVQALRMLLDSLALIQQHLRHQTRLLHEILERQPKPHYPASTGLSVTVTP